MASLGQRETADVCWNQRHDCGHRNDAADVASAKLAERGDRQERLTRTIESEIIPRLMLAHGGASQAVSQPVGPAAVDAGDVERFASLLLAAEQSPAEGFVKAMRDRGVSLEAVFLDLMAPAARHLGELWKADLCDFVDVTMGLSRLQRMLRDLGPCFEGEGAQPDGGRRILLIPAPGEQHTFGLAMVEEFFRRSGWDVWVEAPRTVEELGAYLRGMWFGVVGMSISGERLLGPLRAAIQAIRRESMNRGVGIMVGGPLLVEQPALASMIGADATAPDARQAVLNAHSLLRLVEGRC